MKKVGILGAGGISDWYVQIFNDLQNLGAEITTVCDLDLAKANSTAKKAGAIATTSYEDLLKDPDIDVVIILTSSGHHYQHAKLALQGGKHVIVEKPAAMIPQHIYELHALADKLNLMYTVMHQNRFNPAVAALKRAVEENRFGKITLATVRLRWCRLQEYYEDGWHGTWLMDGGVINQQAIHHIDALQWICGPVRSVVAANTNALNELEAEDTSISLLNFEDNFLGIIEATTAARPRDFEASISVLGEGGFVEVGGRALNKIVNWEFEESTDEDDLEVENSSEEVSEGFGLSHPRLLQEVFDNLNRESTIAPVSGIEAAECVKLVHAIYTSHEEGKWINLSDNPESKYLGK